VEVPSQAHPVIHATRLLWPLRVVYPIIINILFDFPREFEDPRPKIHTSGWICGVKITIMQGFSVTLSDVYLEVPLEHP